MPDPTRLTLVDAADRIRRRALSPTELLDAVLSRIEALDGSLNTFTTRVPPETARAAAQAAEQEIRAGRYRGPLHGIPVSVKDLIDTAGLRTTYGSGMFRDHVPTVDGAMPERLRAAGAILTGKTATHEFGQGITTNNHFFGPTLNPWHREHVPGGSSGGAAAAAAARLGPLQIGTDGAGSIRIPAAFCGVVGYKPTLGLLSNRGQFGEGNTSFSVPGPLVRTVHDAAVAGQALAGFDPGYIYSRRGPVPDLLGALEAGVRGLRIATSADLLLPPPSADVAAAYAATLRRLERLGAEIVELPFPSHAHVLRVTAAVFGVEGNVHLERMLGDRPRLFSPEVEKMRALMIGRMPEVPALIRAQQDRQRIRHDYDVAFASVDALVLPSTPLPAPRIGEEPNALQFVPYTAPANLAGLPGVALPAGMSDGLPIGVQVIAQRGHDAVALRAAWALEQDADEHRVQEPPLRAG